ncbi:acetylglutamate kinase [bacterium]|nr:MAG: acetylglutamate kinase [bacterium]
MTPVSPAEVLNQALPYIQAFRGRTFVVKLGGSAMKDPAVVGGMVRNALLLHLVGIRLVIVHGGGPEIDTLLARLGIEKRVHRGLRVTDDATMEAVEMALLKANKGLVAEIQRQGGRAIGLSGRDGDLLQAWPIDAELGRVGDIAYVDRTVLDAITNADLIPVVCSVATDKDRRPLNINADSAAAAVARAVGASKLILMTDTDGVLGDIADPASRISKLSEFEARAMISDGRAARGMIPKLEAALHALDGGVGAIHLINGSTPNALLLETFTDEGIGTMMEAGR